MDETQLTGMQALVATLEKLRVEIPGKATRKAVGAGANIVKAEMIARAPVLDEKTAGSTSLEPEALKQGVRVYMKRDADPVEALIGPNKETARVARDVEYGHREVHGGSLDILGGGRTRGTGIQGEDVPAHPWLRPAFEASIGPAEEAMKVSYEKSFAEVLR